MKLYLTTILLCAAVILLTLGMHTNNFILMVIGGFFAGVYDAMIHKQD